MDLFTNATTDASTHGPDWDEFTSEILLLYTASRAPKTIQRMRQVLALAGTLAPRPAALTPEAVARFTLACRERGNHPNTVATQLSYLRRACSYAAARGYLASSPFGAWKGLVRWAPPRPRTVHSPAAIGRVLASPAMAADERLHAWASLLAHTGLRRDEALFLRPEDLDLARGTVAVRRRLKRPTAARTVPLPGGLAAVLARWLGSPSRSAGAPWLFPNSRGNPWSGGAPGYRPIDRLRAAGESAGVAGFTPSSLRHSFATAAATTWGVAPAVLQRWMGHTDMRTTMGYYVHLEIAALVEASARVRFPAA